MSDMYTCTGKQILRDGQHFADVRTDSEADALTLVLNYAQVLFAPEVSPERMDFVAKELWG